MILPVIPMKAMIGGMTTYQNTDDISRDPYECYDW